MASLIRWSWVLGLIGVTALFGALATWYVLGDLSGPPTWFLIGGAAALLLYAGLDRERVSGAVQSRSFLYGGGSTILVTMVLAIAVAGYLLAREHDRTCDLTTTGEFTLSDHTIRVVSGLDRDVEVLAFFRHDSPEQRRFRDLARRFEERSPRFKVQYVDPLRNPRLAEEHRITSDYGVVVLKSGGNTQRIESGVSEDKLANALVVVTSDVEHRICWSTGHGEPDPDDEYSVRGLGGAVTELEKLNYKVTPVHVGTTGIDRECEALVIARPQTDFGPLEREALAAYLAGGGRALILLEPRLAPELAAEMERYGLSVRDDLVFDLNPQNMLLGVDEPTYLVLTGRNIQPHAITRNLSAALVLGIARSVQAVGGEGLIAEDLLRASERSWGETSTDPARLRPDDGVDLIGNVPVGAVVEIADPAVLGVAEPVAPAEPAAPALPVDGAPALPSVEPGRGVPADFEPQAGGRLVVLGDSDFASNMLVNWGNNRDLFLNTLAWLVGEEEQIGERPDDGDVLEVTAIGEAMLCLLSIIVVPGGAVLLAVMTLLRRRFL